ncbi:MAG: GxxExxY protein [Bacteroidales bacterium]
MKLLHEGITSKIIKSYYNVYNTLGYGFLEKVYENAMALELAKHGLDVRCQHPIQVTYDGVIVGEYFADIIVNGIIVIELKATKEISEENECQLINYLKATNIELGLLMNFGKEPEYRRKVFMNNRK